MRTRRQLQWDALLCGMLMGVVAFLFFAAAVSHALGQSMFVVICTILGGTFGAIVSIKLARLIREAKAYSE